jgi:hypothetical protein
MAEPIIEQIAQWINDALDGVQDPDATLTLRSVRPKILDWEESQFAHGDVIIELGPYDTQSTTTTSSRTELAVFMLYAIIRDLPVDTAADTVLARFAETIRRTILAGNALGRACGGLALNIDCPSVNEAIIDGGVEMIIKTEVLYQTALKDGYSAP